MRILIHGVNFSPELVGVGKYTGEMAEWLAAQGHEVRAVTAPPFNPAWKVAPPFSPWRYQREDNFMAQPSRHAQRQECVAAVGHASTRNAASPASLLLDERPASELQATVGRLTVLRCPLWVPQHPSAGQRILHLASFALTSFPVMLRQIQWKPDVVIVIEPTLFTLPAAQLTGQLCRAKTWLHVQDFEADAGFELGFLTSFGLRRILAWWEKRSMLAFDRVSTISEKMVSKLEQKGLPPPARLLFPNWVDTQAIFPLRHPSPLRGKLGFASGDVVALYAGTMARKQGLEILAQAARQLADRPGLHFVFCGEGPGKSRLQSLTAHLANVQWIPLQPFDCLNDLLNLADIHLLPQKADAADLVMPSKLTGMLASGRPVVATSRPGTQLAQVVSGRGVVVEPGDAPAFAAAIEQLLLSPAWRETLGKRAREYAISELEKESVLSRFEDELLALVASR